MVEEEEKKEMREGLQCASSQFPLERGVMCSISKDSGEKSAGVWQYSQRSPARRAMKSLSIEENLRRLNIKMLDSKLTSHFRQRHLPQLG